MSNQTRQRGLGRLLHRAAAALDGFRAVGAVSAAVEAGRQPNAVDLEALGIDPEQFKKIRLG